MNSVSFDTRSRRRYERSLAEALNAAGFVCVGADVQGWGKSGRVDEEAEASRARVERSAARRASRRTRSRRWNASVASRRVARLLASTRTARLPPLRGRRPRTVVSRRYFESFDDLVNDARLVFDDAAARHPDLPVFILGCSFGGLIAATLARELTSPHAPAAPRGDQML